MAKLAPEVGAAVIRVAGEWTLALAKGYRIDRKHMKDFLAITFDTTYGIISNSLDTD